MQSRARPDVARGSNGWTDQSRTNLWKRLVFPSAVFS